MKPTTRQQLRALRVGLRTARAVSAHPDVIVPGTVSQRLDDAEVLLNKSEDLLDMAEHMRSELKAGRPQRKLLGMVMNALVNPSPRRTR